MDNVNWPAYVLCILIGMILLGLGVYLKKHMWPLILKAFRSRFPDRETAQIVANVVQRSAQPPIITQQAESTEAVEGDNPILNGFELSEKEIAAVDTTLAGAKERLDGLLGMSPGEAKGSDLFSDISDASRQYGELYWARHRRIPPDWT